MCKFKYNLSNEKYIGYKQLQIALFGYQSLDNMHHNGAIARANLAQNVPCKRTTRLSQRRNKCYNSATSQKDTKQANFP